MSNTVIQILTGALGSLGFGILLRMHPKHLPWATLGGGITWIVYLIASGAGMNLFFSNLIAALAANVYAMLMAVLWKSPAVIFRTTAVVPLIPGSGLYYTMSALVAGEKTAAAMHGSQTLLTAAAIGFGTLIFSALMHLLAQIKARHATGTVR